MPAFYKAMATTPSAICTMFHLQACGLLLTLNKIYSALSFAMKLEDKGKLPCLRTVIIRNGPRLDNNNTYYRFRSFIQLVKR